MGPTCRAPTSQINLSTSLNVSRHMLPPSCQQAPAPASWHGASCCPGCMQGLPGSLCAAQPQACEAPASLPHSSLSANPCQLGLPSCLQIKVKVQAGDPRAPPVCCDISIGSDSGPAAVDTLLGWQRRFPQLHPLCLCVKAFLRVRSLHDASTGGLSSFSQANMVMAHLLQEEKVREPAGSGKSAVEWPPWGLPPGKVLLAGCACTAGGPALLGFELSSFIQPDDGPPAEEQQVGELSKIE